MKKNITLFLLLAFLIFILPALQIYSAKAMEEDVFITVVRADNKRMRVKINPDKSLSDLRSKLTQKRGISPNDIFYKARSDIFRDEEDNWKIRDVVVYNTLFLKSESASSFHYSENAKQYYRQEEQRKLKVRQEEELKKRKQFLSIRESSLDECIKQYDILTSPNLTYNELCNVCLTVKSLYQQRQALSMEQDKLDPACESVLSHPLSDPGVKICWLWRVTLPPTARVNDKSYPSLKEGLLENFIKPI